LAVIKRGKKRGRWYVYFRPFGGRKIGLRVDATNRKDAEEQEALLMRACRTGNYNILDDIAREALVRMFNNQEWELPKTLKLETQIVEQPESVLTLWKSAEIFLRSPSVADTKERSRYEICLTHLVGYFGKDTPMKNLWVPEIRTYIAHRSAQGAAPATINREKGTLSKIFHTLLEYRLVEANPARLVPNLSQKSGERQVYISFGDVGSIAQACPTWFQRLIWASFYSGMRRGEILSLNRRQVDLSKRILTLTPSETKESHWKRIPVHRDFVPILEEAMRVPYLASDRVFLLQDKKGIRPIGVEATKNPWDRACQSLGLEKPWPRFHDLRHTWRSNARRSGVPDQIAEMIMGHALRGKRVDERYGYISDEELVDAIDRLTFENGTTKIYTASGFK